MKITGGAGYAADAIEVFECIDGTLLMAALSLVIFLLIVIYRSPIFFLVPLVAVVFAEMLARSLGYGVSELGVTINGQSSSIMSILVLGAGTDYALLLVARYREELHNTADKHEAMATALASAGPAIFASAATVIAALFCLTIAKVNGTSGLGPIGALGVACAALSMLTLLPALLTIFGRRAFWPFVPNTPDTAPTEDMVPAWSLKHITEGGRATALTSVIVAGLVVLLLLPLVLLNLLVKLLVAIVVRWFTDWRFPSLIVGPLDKLVFRPYELRRYRREHLADATHGFWKRVGDWVAPRPQPRAARLARRAAGALLRPRLLLHRPDQQRRATAPRSSRSRVRRSSARASPPDRRRRPTSSSATPGGSRPSPMPPSGSTASSRSPRR